jgi:hypothetical protein
MLAERNAKVMSADDPVILVGRKFKQLFSVIQQPAD